MVRMESLGFIKAYARSAFRCWSPATGSPDGIGSRRNGGGREGSRLNFSSSSTLASTRVAGGSLPERIRRRKSLSVDAEWLLEKGRERE
ncbi:unnamed protein product, partial [Linum tenue]